MITDNFLKRGLIVVMVILMIGFVVFGCAPQGADNAQENGGQDAQENGEQDNAQKLEKKNKKISELEKKLKLVTQDNSETACTGGCHEGEYSLQNQTEDIEGHPGVESDSLTECMECHASGEYAFKTVIHKAHLIEGEHYTDEYDKNCINCHEISEEGHVTVEGLENGQDENNAEENGE